MKRILAALLMSGILAGTLSAQDQGDSTVFFGLLQIDGELNEIEFETLEQSLRSVDEAEIAALVLNFNSAGGTYNGIENVVDAIEDLEIPVYSLVTTLALGPAALLAMTADSIFMAADSRIGSPGNDESPATPRVLAALSETFAAAAGKHGLDPAVGRAMINPDIVIPGLVEADSLLSLSHDQAQILGLSARTVESTFGLAEAVGFYGAEFEDVRLAGSISLVVENRNFMDARIYVVRSGSRFRMGVVRGTSTRRFRIRSVAGPGDKISLLAVFIGSTQSLGSEEVRIEEGIIVEWRIENRLSLSSIFIYSR